MPIGIAPWAKERNEKIASLMSAEDRARLQEIRKQTETADAEQIGKLCPEEFRIIFRPYLANPGDHSDVWNRMCDVSVEAMRNGGVTGGAVINSLGEFDLRPVIKKFRGPVLVIEGEKTNVPLSSTLEWATSPARGRLLMIPDSGHAVFIEQPAAMLKAIEVFLRGKWPYGAAMPKN
jgi:pimeloyl-ACP methyl ester carboxylesterase